MELYNNYVKIDLDVLRSNFQKLQEKVHTPILMVVKADAYGHGAVPVAKCLENHCAFFGVAAVSEALELRRAGIQTPILMLGHTPISAFSQIVSLGIRPAIFRYDDAVALSQEAQKQGVTAPFHFAVDTGMSRIGFQVTQDDADICKAITQLPNLEAEGLFSHFATADCADQSSTLAQNAAFQAFDAMLQQRGVQVKLRHIENSAALLNFKDHYDLVRAGIVAYGMNPSDDVPKELADTQPALSWYSRVTFVKQLEAGRKISYGGTYTTVKPTTVATVCVGYADGYRRDLSQTFHVLIRGQKAPILGRVCMDQIMVDVTDIPGVCCDDPVTLIGRDGSAVITAEEMAAALGTINYEITCGISRRVPRQYVQNGQAIETVDYLLDK